MVLLKAVVVVGVVAAGLAVAVAAVLLFVGGWMLVAGLLTGAEDSGWTDDEAWR